MDTKYCSNKEKLLEFIKGCGYSRCVLNSYILYIHQLEEFTESYHSGIYSHSVGYIWICETNVQRKKQGRNRIVGMLKNIQSGKQIKPGNRYYLNPVISTCPKRFKVLLNVYIENIGKYGYSKNTLKPKRKYIVLFLQYIDSVRIYELSNINLNVMNQFVSEALNKYSINTKKKYLSVIRIFFIYLAEQGIISEKLIYCCPSISNIPEKVPSILSLNIQKSLQDLEEPTSEIVARDNAILLLAYRLGLRRSDILNLKLSEIDWGNKFISIVQQKTLVVLKLPLPNDVGDALSNYICNFRKSIEGQNFVFQTISSPIRQLKHSASNAIAERFQKRCGLNKEIHGLQIFRRSCASIILNSGNTPEMVSAILGHSSSNAINSYISLDKEKMRCCAMNTFLIGYPEVLND